MPAAFVRTHPIASEDRQSAQSILNLLRGGSIESASLVVMRDHGKSETVTIAKSLIEAITDYVTLVQNSRQIGIFSDDPEVSPEQAAELLGMSRPTVIQRIRQGELNARMVGAHHRILMSDVLAFLRKEEERKLAEDRADRQSSSRFAIASTVMEGGVVHPETEALLENWAEGEISDDELIARTLQRFTPRA